MLDLDNELTRMYQRDARMAYCSMTYCAQRAECTLQEWAYWHQATIDAQKKSADAYANARFWAGIED